MIATGMRSATREICNVLEGRQPLRNGLVEGPNPDLGRPHKAGFPKNLEVVRNRGLTQIEVVDDVANTGGPGLTPHQAQDLQAGGVR